MAQHGIEQHHVRPDRVYATGVWTPTVGYQPAEAANQVAARFVAGGQGLGLFRQPFGRTRALARSIALRGPGATFWSWLRERVAAARVWGQVHKINAEMRKVAALPAGAARQLVVDTSPRGQAPYPGAIPVQGDWAPAPQSPTSAAAAISDGAAMREQPALTPALAVAMKLAPGSADFPKQYWNTVINGGGGLPSGMNARMEHDALRKFFANREPGAGY